MDYGPPNTAQGLSRENSHADREEVLSHSPRPSYGTGRGEKAGGACHRDYSVNGDGPLRGGEEEGGGDVAGNDDFEEKYGGSSSLSGDRDPLLKSVQAQDEPPPCLTWLQRLMFGLPQFNINYGNALLNVRQSPVFLPLLLSSFPHSLFSLFSLPLFFFFFDALVMAHLLLPPS